MFECDVCVTPHLKKLKEYAKRTPFTLSELSRLSKKFTELDEDGSGTLSTEELCTLPELRANPFRVRMCELFSENGCGQLTFHQFINMMGIFSQRASLEVKIIWAFSIWDFDGDDMLSRADIKQGLLLMTTTSASSSADTGSPTSVLSSDWSCQSVVSDAEQPSLTRKSRHEQALKPEEINMVLEKIFDEVDPMDAGLTFTDFQSVIRRMPDFLENFRMTV